MIPITANVAAPALAYCIFRRRPRHDDPLSPPATYPLRSASIGSGRRRSGPDSPDRDSLVDQVKTLDPLSGATRLGPVVAGAGGGGGNRGRHRGRRLVVPGGSEPEGFGVGEHAASLRARELRG